MVENFGNREQQAAFRDADGFYLAAHAREVEAIPGWSIALPGVASFRFDLDGSEIRVLLGIGCLDGVIDSYEVLVRGVDGRAVTGTDLRRIPILELTRRAIASAFHPRAVAEQGFGVSTHWPIQPSLAEAEHARLVGPTSETLKRIAESYQLAKILNQAPAKMVQEHWKLASATASRWIRAAKEGGFIMESPAISQPNAPSDLVATLAKMHPKKS